MLQKTKTFHYLIIAVMIAAFIGIAGIFPAGTAHAFTTPGYKVDVKVNDNYTFDYTETIDVDFGNYAQHGIFRYIPMDATYKIKNIRVDGYDYDIYKDSGSEVVKIGSADYTLTGRHTYVIHYTIQGIRDNDPNADFMYIDLLPTSWETSIGHASATISLPKDFKTSKLEHYVGGYGSTADIGSWNVTNRTITFDAYDLKQGEGVTVYAEMPDGTWVDPLNYDWLKFLVLLIIAAGVAAMLGLRITLGRNPQVIETVEFYPPDNLTPLDIGYVIDGNVDPKDMTSTFFYLADKGYITINEYAKEKFEFTRVGNLDPAEKESITRFYRGLFGSTSFNDYESVPEKKRTVRANQIGGRMHTAYENIPSLVDDEFSGAHKLFTSKSKFADSLGKFIFFLVPALTATINLFVNNVTQSIWFPFVWGAIFGGIFLFLANKLCSVYYYRKSRRGANTFFRFLIWVSVYAVAAMIYFAIFTAYDEISYHDNRITTMLIVFFVAGPLLLLGMKSRSEWSSALYGRVLGFKNFIKTAELDKLEMLVEENPSYFFNILPYAYVFGLTKKWAAKFENIPVEQPDWYSPCGMNGSPYFNVVMMNSMFDHVSTGVNTSIHNAVKSSRDHGVSGGSGGGRSGGGFGGFSGGGGGFSGGGFGGGGGGSW